MDVFCFKKFPSLKGLVICVAIGLLIMILFYGKSAYDIEAAAVSSDEQYVAYFETGKGWRIRCFYADGLPAFSYDIPTEISAGGFCTLWFEENTLCAYFYRTDKTVHFALDGTILEILTDEGTPPEDFEVFSKKGHKYIFEGEEICVVYDKQSFLGYWFLGEQRQLTITPKNGQTKTIYTASAKGE